MLAVQHAFEPTLPEGPLSLKSKILVTMFFFTQGCSDTIRPWIFKIWQLFICTCITGKSEIWGRWLSSVRLTPDYNSNYNPTGSF
jgi:hypothetical protein